MSKQIPVSLQPNEVLVLIDHYETLANEVEKLAVRFTAPASDDMIALVTDYRARAVQIREQAAALITNPARAPEDSPKPSIAPSSPPGTA